MSETTCRVAEATSAVEAIGNPRRTNRPLTALATRLTLSHEEGSTGRCPRVLTGER